MTSEKFFDISSYASEGRVEVRLDHGGDMKEYLFAIIAHPPTMSQLRELDERRAKKIKFRAVIEGLRLTAAEIFG